MPSNTVTDTNKKTLFYVYWFCIFLCLLDFKREIVRRKKKSHPSGHSLNLIWDAYFWDIKLESLFNISSFQFFSCLLKIRSAEDLVIVLKMWELLVLFLPSCLLLVQNSLILCIFMWSHHYWDKVFFLVIPTGTALLCFSGSQPTSLKSRLQKCLSC